MAALALVAATALAAPPLAHAADPAAGAPPVGPARNGLLAYAHDGDIWARDATGANPRVLIGGPEADAYPMFSPDGTRLTFERTEAGAPPRLMAANADGSGVVPLVDDVGTLQWVEWTPDSHEIAVVRREGPLPAIVLLAVDGSGTARVIDTGDVAPRRWLAFRGADGSRIVFAGRRANAGPLGLYEVGTDGGTVRTVVVSTDPNPELPFQDLAISPAGDRLAFWSWEDLGEGANSYIHLLDLDTGEDRVLDLDPAYPRLGLFPWFSPDGASLLFETGPHDAAGGPTDEGGNAQLVFGPLDGSTPARPLGPAYGDRRPALLSPDGTVVISWPEEGGTPLWIDVATGEATPLDASIRQPSWQRLVPQG